MMNQAANTVIIGKNIRAKTPWFIFVLIALAFLIGSDFSYSLRESYDPSLDQFVEMTSEGNLLRRIALPSLTLLALIGLMRKGVSHLKSDGILGYLLVFYCFWCFISICWSTDPALTFRRLMVFSFYCIIALSLASRFSIECLPKFVLFLTAITLSLSIAAEISSGTFHPFTSDHRFAGVAHPNVTGFSCAMMFLASFCFAGAATRWRSIYLMVALVGLIGLILTKSRTSFAGAIAAQTIFWLYTSSRSKRLGFVLISGWILGFLTLISAGDFISAATGGILLNRTDSEVSNFSGRTFIWKECLEYVAERPLQGFGFNSFWTIPHIKAVSNSIGMGLIEAHSAYIDITLNLGLIGLTLYLSIILLGSAKSLQYYGNTQNIGYAFLFKISLLFLIHGVLESGTTQLGVGALVLMWGLIDLGFKDHRILDAGPNQIV